MSAEYPLPRARLASLLGGYHYRYGSEVQLHQALSTVLTDAGFEHEREVALDARNRADFWLEGIVIEVKVDGSLAAALRQCQRYLALPQVHAVLLASTQRWADTAMAKRPELAGKPFHIVRLRRQTL